MQGRQRKILKGAMGALLVVFSLIHLAAPAASASQFHPPLAGGALRAAQNLGALRPEDFSRIYPDGLHFRIIRNGEPIGFHTARAVHAGDEVTIENHTVMKTRVFLSLIPYSMEYRAASRWRDGRFVDFRAEVMEQGDKSRIALFPEGDVLRLHTSGGLRTVSGEVVPSPHWLSVYIKGAGLLHGVSGEIWDITYAPEESIRLHSEGRQVEARRYALVNASLKGTEWYDSQGRWLAMRFEAPDGSTVEYECVECGQPRGITLTQLTSR